MKKIQLNSWWSNLLNGVLATAIGVGLTFEVNKLVERHNQQEAQRQAEEEAKAEQRAQDVSENVIPEENLTEEEREQLREKQAILKLIDEKPAEVAMLVKLWLAEDE